MRERPKLRGRQRDSEPGHCKPQQHLARSQQIGDLGSGEHLQLTQPIVVGTGALQASPL